LTTSPDAEKPREQLVKPCDFTSIVYDLDDCGVVTITINRPEIRNALTLRVLLELFWAADAVAQDPAVKAVIITGAKRQDHEEPSDEAFSSGGYFNPAELESMSAEMQREVDLSDLAQKRLCLKFWEIDKPVIAAINGLAVGGGFTIPFACADLIYLSEHAWVRLPFVRLGITPELAASYLFPRLLGMHKTKEIFFFGDKLSARGLLDLGLVNAVLPHDRLIPFAKEMALKLIPPCGAYLAVRWTKQILHKPLIEAVTQALDRENHVLNQAFGTSDFFEAVSARIQKRDPVFQGK
jgi:enoyl-CoA hydratase/carnithine racemase